METPPPKYFRLRPGGEVRLKYAYIIRCGPVVKDAAGNCVELHCTADLDSKVGGPNAGPNGEAEWLQAGLNVIADGRAEIYGELTLPGRSPIYKTIGQVKIGKSYRLAVLEVPGKPGTWQVYLNGKPVSKQVFLRGSHGAFEPMAMTESWNGGTPSCNDFSYRFDRVLVAGRPGSWARLTSTSAGTLTDVGYRVARTTAGFVAGRGI